MYLLSTLGARRCCRPSFLLAPLCSIFLLFFVVNVNAQNWYLPIDNSPFGEPAVNAAAAPAGYFFAPDQACVQTVVDADPYCVTTDWDNICQDAYNDCAYGAGCDWYIPNTVGGGPAVWACAPPADYGLANQNCAQIEVNGDSFCVDTNWDNLCQTSYCACATGCTDPAACNYDPAACTDDGSCIFGYWYLPNTPGGGPAVFACTPPADYFFADQACAQTVVDGDPFCVNNTWDGLCQDNYNDCLYGAGCDWYLPTTVGAGPAVWACAAPADYYFANQNCAQSVINNDPFCVQTNWDTTCQNAYCACVPAGCTDPAACNYDPAVCTDDGSCVYGYWYLPNTGISGPAVFACTAPADYFFADQACAQTVVDADPFCVNNTWDGLCQDNYNDCLYGDGCDWYLPTTVGAGPAVWACAAPVDYYLANQACAQSVITDDPFCVQSNWDTLCQNAYCACVPAGCTDPAACNYDPSVCTDDGSCVYGYWYLPDAIGGGPAVFACTAPADYFFADQVCAQTVVDADPFCVDTNWDGVCQNAYNNCLYGAGCDWYLPNTVGAGPAVWACAAPVDYYFANQACAQSVINNDPFCVQTNWDAICQDAYCACLPGCTDPVACNYDPNACSDDGSCTYPQWYLPNVVGGGPAISSCTQPADYFLADQACVQTVVDNDPFCLNNNWDSICQTAYDCCLNETFGCTDFFACNYDPAACTDDGSCTYPGCTDAAACNFDAAAGCDDGSCTYPQWYIPDPSGGGPAVLDCVAPAGYILADQDCAQSVIDNDPFCVDTNWDSICQAAYDCCVSGTGGCQDPFACNFNPLATCDDGSCTYPGCTYADACNYNPFASCDDGSCLYLDACGNCGGSDIAGCTDPAADNYDPAAACDDGSCFISGCTYPDADNYNSSATVDDGTCTFPTVNNCPEDLNQDGVVNAADLLQFLGAFGTVCP